jgi:hypothetical protein
MARTERQEQWLATAIANLEADTGKSLAQWVQIARTCPEPRHRGKLAWFKEHHGLGMNRASIILGQLDDSPHAADDDRAALDRLWTDPASRALYEAVAVRALGLEGTIIGPRKGFTGFSRTFQFAAMRPLKGGRARLGLDVTADADPRLKPMTRDGWSERLKSTLELTTAADVDDGVGALLRQAWSRAG